MRLALIVLMLAPLAGWSEQWYHWTGADGQPQQSTSLSDVGTNAYTVADSPASNQAPDAAPVPLPSGIEVPVVVLQDVVQAGKAYGYYSINGELVGGILDHASPRDPAAIAQRIESNRLERIAMRQDARTVRTNMVALSTSSTTAAAQQQQIEELRLAVRDLAAIIRKQLKDSQP